MTYEIAQTDDVNACRALRVKIFVEEQSAPMDEEIDDLDGVATHILATFNGVPIGTTRLLTDPSGARIGRFCVVKEHRGKGVGKLLMEEAMQRLTAINGMKRISISSQSHAIGFYEQFGFEPYGDDYLDAGILHRSMVREF